MSILCEKMGTYLYLKYSNLDSRVLLLMKMCRCGAMKAFEAILLNVINIYVAFECDHTYKMG